MGEKMKHERETIYKVLTHLNKNEMLNMRGSKFKRYPFGFISRFADRIEKALNEGETKG